MSLWSGVIRLPRWATAAIIAAVLAGWAIGPQMPHSLVGSVGWAAVAYSVLFGLGMMVRRRSGIHMYLGETLLVGTGVWIFGAGALLAAGLASRGPLLALAALGSLWGVAELVLGAVRPPSAPAAASDGDGDGALRRVGLVLLALAAIYFLLNLTGSLSSRGNPADDWVAYAGFVRRMLDAGDLVEPFSFRRLSAYGGQTALLALTALRGDYESFDFADRGLFQPVVALLLLELARRRRLHLGATVLVVGFVMAQMETRFNSASHWTGIAVFLGAYLFAVREDLSPRAQLVMLYALCGVACTLRQNFIMAAALFAVLVTVFHLRSRAAGRGWRGWRAALIEERATLGWSIAATAVVVLPYMVAAWHSSHTFLYPVLLGTGNPVTPLRPVGATFYDELVFFFVVFFNSEPVRAWWVLVPFLFMVRDPRPNRPFTALLWSSLLAFVYLTHSFTLSDAYNIWRYAAGYMTPLLAVFFAELVMRLPFWGRREAPAPGLGDEAGEGASDEAGADDEAGARGRSGQRRIGVPEVAGAVALFVMLLQLVESRFVVIERLRENARQTQTVKVLGTVRTQLRERSYRAMQASIPAGAAAGGKVAAMVDEAMWLDYRRNELVNLDVPGFAAPAPGLPSFLPPEVWRSYFHSQGIRYLMYVDGDYSLYLYRRQAWADATYSDHGIWRFMATHVVDAIDKLRALKATSKVLYDAQGFVAIDLGPIQPVDRAALLARYAEPEVDREYEWLQRQVSAELDPKIWELMTRKDLVFDGVDPIEFSPVRRGFLQALGLPLPKAVPPHRWLSDRSHIRLHGDGAHRLQAELWIDRYVLGTQPSVSLLVDGQELFLSRPVYGKVALDVPVICHGWCDAYLNVSTIGTSWQTASQVRGIRLDAIRWIRDASQVGAAGAQGAP